MDKNDVDESLIEATIRRVAAQAARADETPDAAEPQIQPASSAEGPADWPSPAEARVAPDEGLEVTPAEAPFAQPAINQDVDESAIEAAIRRVQAAKEEREQEPATAMQPEDGAREPGEPISFPTRGSVLPRAEYDPTPGGLAVALERIERTLTDINQTVRLLATQMNLHPAPSAPSLGQAESEANEWEDEAPAVASAGFGALPRPPIFRDVAPAQPEAPSRPAPGFARAPTFEPEPAPAPVQRDEPRGLDLLPRTYRITVEDKRRAVDLVPLHRALLGLDGVRDMSLLSYNNGVALVSLEAVHDLDTDVLARAVTRAMSREARVETHNERTLVIKLAED
jgi:hypothetical protein